MWRPACSWSIRFAQTVHLWLYFWFFWKPNEHAVAAWTYLCSTNCHHHHHHNEITASDRPLIHENFRPASLCFNIQKSQTFYGTKSVLLGAWVRPVLNWANISLPNMVWMVRRTMIHFLTDFLMRCKLQPELCCAGCTQTCVHMLTHDTCSLSSVCGWKPRHWTPWLCQALTYLLVFICWVPQITLTLSKSTNEAISSEVRGWKHSRHQLCVAVSVFSLFHRWALDPEHSFIAVHPTARTRFTK